MPVDVKFKRRFSAGTGTTIAADFHPSEPWLLTGHTLGDVRIYNPESGVFVHTFSLDPAHVNCAKFIARKDWYVVGSRDGNLHIFDCTTHEEVVVFRAHTSAIECIAFHPTAPIVLTGSYDNTIKAWDWDKQWDNIQTYQGHTDWIKCVSFNPKDPNTFASASHDRTVKMWSVASPIPDFTIKGHDHHVNCVNFYPGPDKLYLITASSDRTVKVWDYFSQTCVQTMKGHTDGVLFAVFHPSLPMIISGGYDRTVKIWNSESYGIEDTLSYELGWAMCIALHGDISEVAVGFANSVLTLELGYSEAYQIAESKDDMSGEAEKAKRIWTVDVDVGEPTLGTTTDQEHEHELAQSLDNLTVAYDTAFILSSPPNGVHKLDPYQHCITLVTEFMADKTIKKLISELRGDKAQYMADFFSKMVSDENMCTRHDRKHTLYLLSRLAKSAEVFPRYLELKGVRCNLTDPVAAGGYGFIYKGEYEGSTICIKAVRTDSRGVDEKKMRNHASELIFWGHLSHPNVLPFLGIYPSKEKVSRVCIVSPWMHNGDLLEYLNTVSDVPRKPLVRDVISGLQYLHDLDIIHADLKAKNVLISAAGRAMLADFGISRLSVTLTMTSTKVSAGTAYWMAPELHLDDEPSPSRETDIWGFACTCYEIITGMAPFSQYRHPVMLIGAFMRGKIVPLKPTPGIGWDEDVWSIAMRCWQRDPASRPRAQELLDMIKSFKFLDDRPSDPEFQRRSYPKIDYDCISHILDEIRQSAII